MTLALAFFDFGGPYFLARHILLFSLQPRHRCLLPSRRRRRERELLPPDGAVEAAHDVPEQRQEGIVNRSDEQKQPL